MSSNLHGRQIVGAVGFVLGVPMALLLLLGLAALGSPSLGYLVIFVPLALGVACLGLLLVVAAGSLNDPRPTFGRFFGGLASGAVASIMPIGGWWPERKSHRAGTELIWRPSLGMALFLAFFAILILFWLPFLRLLFGMAPKDPERARGDLPRSGAPGP